MRMDKRFLYKSLPHIIVLVFFISVLTIQMTAIVAFRELDFRATENATLIVNIVAFVQALLYALTPLALYTILPIKRIVARVTVAYIVSWYYLVTMFFNQFFVLHGLEFDFFYFWSNREAALPTIQALYDNSTVVLIVIVIASFIIAWLLMSIRALIRQKIPLRTWYFVALIVVMVVNTLMMPVPFHISIGNAYVSSNIDRFSVYNEYYRNSAVSTVSEIKEADTGNSLFFLHLESLNSQFIDPATTPSLYKAAEQGILLTKHLSNAVQTHRAEESILCSTLPSLRRSYSNAQTTYRNVSDVIGQSRLKCLPSIFKQAGYTTLFFKNHDLTFQRAGEFALAIGFDEVHDSDITQPGDPYMKWGFREDIYYKRVLEYIEKNFSNDKVFVYIAVSATNHTNFDLKPRDVRTDVYDSMPYAGHTQDYLEARINAVYAQDAYVNDFFTLYRDKGFDRESDIFIFGDHPMAITSKGSLVYSYNIDDVTPEHFLTGFAFVPAANHAEQFIKGVVIDDILGTEHMDIAATALELSGIDNPYPYGTSLYELLQTGESSTLCSINAQPYQQASLLLLQYPSALILNVFNQSVEYINLKTGMRDASFESNLQNVGTYLEACLSNMLDGIPSIKALNNET